MQGTDPTLIAPTGMHPKSRSKLPFVLAGVLLLGGGAAAVVATQSGSSTAPTPAPTPAPAAIPVPAPAATVAAPAKVTIKLTIDPSTALVTVDGKPVTGELVVDKDAAEHELSITAAGFVTYTEKLRFDESQRLMISLEKQRATRPTRPTKPRTNRTDRIDTASPYGGKD